MPKLLYIASSLLTLASSPAGLHGGGASTPLALVAALAPASPAPAATTVAAVERRSRPGMVIERSGDGLFYVEAQVNGAPVHFVVDSGASVVVLSAADAARAAVGGREGVAVETAGGSSPMRRAQIRHVELAGQTLTNVDAAIVSRDLKVSLLGQSALSQLSAVTFRGNRLEFE